MNEATTLKVAKAGNNIATGLGYAGVSLLLLLILGMIFGVIYCFLHFAIVPLIGWKWTLISLGILIFVGCVWMFLDWSVEYVSEKEREETEAMQALAHREMERGWRRLTTYEEVLSETLGRFRDPEVCLSCIHCTSWNESCRGCSIGSNFERIEDEGWAESIANALESEVEPVAEAIVKLT